MHVRRKASAAIGLMTEQNGRNGSEMPGVPDVFALVEH